MYKDYDEPGKEQQPLIPVGESKYGRLLRLITKGFIVFFFLLYLLYMIGAFSTQYFFMLPGTMVAISVGLLIVLTFLLKRGFSGNSKTVPWYDWLFIVAGLVGTLYMAPASRQIQVAYASPVLGPLEFTLGIITILVLLEGTRRISGIILPIILILFIFYAMYCNYFPGVLMGRPHDFNRVMSEMYLSYSGIFGDVTSLWVTILSVFLLFGGLLEASGAGRFFINLSLSVFGRFRGGPAKVAVLASAFFGTLSGSAGANVATTGVITIPMMKRAGYSPEFAGSVESVASTGGIITPPVMGTVAFLIAQYMGLPYATVALAAVIPAVLYYFLLFWVVDFEAVKRNLKGMQTAQIPPFKKTLREGWFYFVPLMALIYFLIIARFPGGLSVVYATGILFVATLFKKDSRLNFKRIMAGLESAASASLGVGLLCASIGIMITSVNLSGMALRMTTILTQIAGGDVFLLLVAAALVSFVLGIGIPAMASYVFLAVTIAPALAQLGIPLLAANFFILYWGTCHQLTPPVGGALYVAKALAGTGLWRQGFSNLRLGVSLYMLPFIFVFHPALLLMGSPQEIVWTTFLALVGMFILACGIIGWLIKPLNWVQRIVALGSALCFYIQGPIATPVGFAIIVILLFWLGAVQLLSKKFSSKQALT